MENLQKIKCLIVDDEPIARKIIINYISQISFLENAGECKNGIEALDLISKDKEIQIVFLDINMPNLNGLSMAKIIKNNIIVIFTTAYSEYAVESYDVNAIDYLLKPFSFERFTTAVFKAVEKLKISTISELNRPELVENKKIFIKQFTYVLLNKPHQCLTSKDDPSGLPLVTELLPVRFQQNLDPIGHRATTF